MKSVSYVVDHYIVHWAILEKIDKFHCSFMHGRGYIGWIRNQMKLVEATLSYSCRVLVSNTLNMFSGFGDQAFEPTNGQALSYVLFSCRTRCKNYFYFAFSETSCLYRVLIILLRHSEKKNIWNNRPDLKLNGFSCITNLIAQNSVSIVCLLWHQIPRLCSLIYSRHIHLSTLVFGPSMPLCSHKMDHIMHIIRRFVILVLLCWIIIISLSGK